MVTCHYCGKEFEPPPLDPRLTGCCIVFVCSEECYEAHEPEAKPVIPDTDGFARMAARERQIKPLGGG